MAEQEKLHGEMSQMWEIYKKCMPDVASAYDELPMEVYKDGVLSGKIKRMMALTGALVHGCRACILYQTEEALTLGATAEEILEACAVAISLGGTMGAGEDNPCCSVFRGERTFGGVKKGQLIQSQPFSNFGDVKIVRYCQN